MQTIVYNNKSDNREKSINIKESNSFKGIPYSDYFRVNTEWRVTQHQKDYIDNYINIKIYLEFIFYKSTWLQGTIESNTKAELLTIYDLWYQTALNTLHNIHNKAIPIDNTVIDISYDEQISSEQRRDNQSYKQPPSNLYTSLIYPHPTVEYEVGSREEEMQHLMIEEGIMYDSDDIDNNNNNDEDLSFYDCRELDERTAYSRRSYLDTSLHNRFNPTSTTSATTTTAVTTTNTRLTSPLPSDTTGGGPKPYSEKSLRPPLPPPKHVSVYASTSSDNDRDMYTNASANNMVSSSPLPGGSSNVHELAVTIVETVFVIMEYVYWKVG